MKFEISKDECLRLAQAERDSEVGAGLLARDPDSECPECKERYEAQVQLADLLSAAKARLREVLVLMEADIASGKIAATEIRKQILRDARTIVPENKR